MTSFRTCVGCAQKNSGCQHLANLKAAIKGLKVSLVRHKCEHRVPEYQPGDAVLVETYAWVSGLHHAVLSCDDFDDGPPKRTFRGVYIGPCKETWAVAFIKPGTLCEEGDFEFEPAKGGFVKAPLSRLGRTYGVPRISVEECGKGIIRTLVAPPEICDIAEWCSFKDCPAKQTLAEAAA